MSLIAPDSVYDLDQTLATEVVGAPQMAWGVSLTLSSSDEANYPKEVFVYQVEDFLPDSRGWFSTVATPGDLSEYPLDEPAAPVEGVQQPYFRLAIVRLISRSPADLEQAIADIRERIYFLEKNLRSLIALTA